MISSLIQESGWFVLINVWSSALSPSEWGMLKTTHTRHESVSDHASPQLNILQWLLLEFRVKPVPWKLLTWFQAIALTATHPPLSTTLPLLSDLHSPHWLHQPLWCSQKGARRAPALGSLPCWLCPRYSTLFISRTTAVSIFAQILSSQWTLLFY